jgi:hypothetical protein
LAADNSKTYWTAHKAAYDAQVYEPAVELLAELEPEFGPGKIFRPTAAKDRVVEFFRTSQPL